LSDNEFKELQNFGKNEEKIVDKNKITVDYKTVIKKFLVFLINNFKKIIYFLIKETKLLFNFLNLFLKEYFNKRKKKKIIIKYKLKDPVFGHKIVEIKKQRRNKTIIIRKRVPFFYDTKNIQPKINKNAALFYMALKTDKNGNHETKPETYTHLKESVWDFPIEKRKKT